MLVASAALPLLLFLLTAWYDYNEQLTDAGLDLTRTSEVASEDAARVFARQRDVSDRISDLVKSMTPAQIAAREGPLHEQFADWVGHSDEIQNAVLIAANGQPLVSATIYPVSPSTNLSDRDYFRATMGIGSGTFISNVQRGEVIKRLFFSFGRRWITADGRVNGIIDIAISVDYFQNFYRLLINEEGDAYKGKLLALVRDDGQILLRYPHVRSPLPRLSRPNPFLAATARNPESGIYESRSIINKPQPLRIFAYRKIEGFPLYVVAGRSKSIILLPWWHSIIKRLAIGIPGTLALVALTWTALVRTEREERALAQADAEMLRRERAERELLQAQRLEAVGQLTGGVAHDFNNLLTVIIGSAELLERRAHDAAAIIRLAGHIKSASERGAEITAKLLSFSRQQRVNPKVIDVNASLREFEPLLLRAANESVAITFDFAPAVFPASLDPGQFEAAILNLVGNARDALPSGGKITISTRNDVNDGAYPDVRLGPMLLVTVADDGMGMDRETAAKAIEPFFTTKAVGRGTGLGLSQVYGFTKQSAGDLRIETALGQGTIMTMLLPGCALELVAPKPTPPATQAGAMDEEVVLVVEDEPQVREIAIECLQSLGYKTLSAADAEAALTILRRRCRIDLLFSDIVMPGALNGVQLAREALSLRPGLKVLLTSGYNSVPGTAWEDIPVLEKPYTKGRLGEQVRFILNHHDDLAQP